MRYIPPREREQTEAQRRCPRARLKYTMTIPLSRRLKKSMHTRNKGKLNPMDPLMEDNNIILPIKIKIVSFQGIAYKFFI